MSDYNTVDYSIDNGIRTIAMNRQLIDETALAFDEATGPGRVGHHLYRPWKPRPPWTVLWIRRRPGA